MTGYLVVIGVNGLSAVMNLSVFWHSRPNFYIGLLNVGMVAALIVVAATS